ncbi:uncharacterized protein LOC143247730 isoform X2 [Tachypleus tridentatus]
MGNQLEFTMLSKLCITLTLYAIVSMLTGNLAEVTGSENIDSYLNKSLNAHNASSRGRDGKFLSIFTLAVFENDACNTSSINRTGICFSSSECISRGGRAEGICAGGYGVCCLFEVTCDGNSFNNGTYFQNPNYPGGYNEARTCQAFIRKVHFNVCQFRLDFISFDISQPTNGVCNSDRLVISGQSQNSVVPPICGLNTGQHLYIEVAGTEGPIQLNVITQGSRTRSFDIRITQIGCQSRDRAPPNCLQYYTGVQGEFRSFNHVSDVAINDQGYFNNLDYTICFRKEVGFCTMTYSLPEFVPPPNQQQQIQVNPFFGIQTGAGGLNQQLTTAGAGMQECTTDYIILASIRLCGGRLNDKLLNNIPPNMNKDVIDTTNGPFTARFVTNSEFISRGFLINYRQNPCTSGR